jgi:hypothetical protein
MSNVDVAKAGGAEPGPVKSTDAHVDVTLAEFKALRDEILSCQQG